MTFLFDENLSWRLVKRLADHYPACAHVNELGLERSADGAIWQRAAADGFVIVPKNDDFRQRAMVYGAPPKTIWLRLGNASTAEIERVLRTREADIRDFIADRNEAMLVLHGAS